MAVYRITAPDGSIHDVTAPNNATPAQVRDYARRALSQAPEGQGWLNSLHGAASAALDGALPGAGRVASGLINMAGNAIAAPLSSSIELDPAGSFRSGRAAGERHEERFKQDHPTLGKAATAAGFVGGFALPVTKLGLGVRGAQAALKGRMLNSAVNGATYGAAGGALDSHADTAGGTLQDAARGALMGAGAGTVLPVAGRALAPIAAPVASAANRLASPVLSAATRLLPGAAGRHLENRSAVMGAEPADAQASRYLGHVMDRAGLDSAGLIGELQRRQGLGVPAVPADVSEHLRGAYGAATRRPGPATMSVRRAIDERQRQQTQRVAGHLQETLGPVANVELQADLLNRQAREAAQPLYELSNAQDVPLTPELRELFSRPAARAAIHEGGEELVNEGINPLSYGLVRDHAGEWDIGPKPTMEAYDRAKTVLDRTVFAGSKPFAPPETDRAARGASAIRGRLLDLMDGFEVPHPNSSVLALPRGPSGQASRLPVPPPHIGRSGGLNPYWKPARDAYAGPIQNRKALELGSDMAKADAVDASNRMADMSGSQTDHFRLGHRSGMVEDLQSLGDYGNAARRVDGSLAKREAIAAVHGQEPATALFDRLQAEHEAHQTWAAVRGKDVPPGADATNRLAQQDNAWDSAGRGVMSAIVGQPIAAVRHIVSALANEPGRNGAVDDRLSGVLGSQDPALVRQALKGARRTRVADRAATARSTARGQQTAKALGARSGAGVATPPLGQALLGYGEDSDGSLYPVFGEPGTDLGPDYLPPQ